MGDSTVCIIYFKFIVLTVEHNISILFVLIITQFIISYYYILVNTYHLSFVCKHKMLANTISKVNSLSYKLVISMVINKR